MSIVPLAGSRHHYSLGTPAVWSRRDPNAPGPYDQAIESALLWMLRGAIGVTILTTLAAEARLPVLKPLVVLTFCAILLVLVCGTIVAVAKRLHFVGPQIGESKVAPPLESLPSRMARAEQIPIAESIEAGDVATAEDALMPNAETHTAKIGDRVVTYRIKRGEPEKTP